MALTERADNDFRWSRTFEAPATLANDLGALGVWVGPRTGPSKRARGQKEDYVLRRLLVAWRNLDRLEFPFVVRAEADRDGQPDFVIAWNDGRTLGLEITEAGSEDYQAWLTSTEGRNDSGDAVPLPGKGSANRISTDAVADEIRQAVARKVTRYDAGKYRSPDACDLVVYDNTRYGGFLDKREVLQELGKPSELLGRFRQVHVVFETQVSVDTLGNRPKFVDLSSAYEIDYARWVFEQVEKLRAGAADRIDLTNLAEELEDLGRSQRRALGSHLRNLLLHMLKWKCQPERRSESWRLSAANARSEIEELLLEMPSLRNDLSVQVSEQYPRARREASAETDLPLHRFPETCPFDLKTQIVNDEYWPD